MRSNFQVFVDRNSPVRSGQKLAESIVKDSKEALINHLEMTARLDDLPNDRRDPLLGARIPECQPTPVLGELSGQPSQHIAIAICLGDAASERLQQRPYEFSDFMNNLFEHGSVFNQFNQDSTALPFRMMMAEE